MAEFLFLVPCSPNAPKGSLRADLQALCFSQLRRLNCDFRVWLLGEPSQDASDFEIIPCSGESKEIKLREACDRLSDEPHLPRYLVRLDDDDLINPGLFEALAKEDFDIAFDRLHWFYDLATDKASAQRRNWIANTAIHRTELALKRIPAIGGSSTEDGSNYLIACDHSLAWHPFYADKKKRKVSEPLYVRILNPESITARSGGEFSKNRYFSYLSTFGRWDAQLPPDFENAKLPLQKIRQKHFGAPLDYRPKKRFFTWKK